MKTEGDFLESDWDRRYKTGFFPRTEEVHELVKRFTPLMPRHRPVIDIAMGRGIDAIFLAQSGLPVVGLEKSGEAIDLVKKASREAGVNLQAIHADASALPFKGGTAGGVLVFNFLQREIIPELVSMLAPGGVMLYQTFLKRQVGLGIGGPKNPAFLLEDGELITRLRSLELLYYEEGIFGSGTKRKALVKFAGRKR
jgi:tellurite methyltransferase